MRYEIKKEITITFSQEEFNTLVAGYGSSTSADKQDVAKSNYLTILDEEKQDSFYTEIIRLAKII